MYYPSLSGFGTFCLRHHRTRRHETTEYPHEEASGYEVCVFSGVCGWDDDGKILHADDIGKQSRVAFENLRDILAEAGVALSDVIWSTEYLVDLRQYREIAKVRAEFFPDNYPAATLVGCTGLFKPGQLFEIQTIAALD